MSLNQRTASSRFQMFRNLRTTSSSFFNVSEVENRLFWIYKCFRIREPLVIIIISIITDICEYKLFENPQRTGSFHDITGQEPTALFGSFMFVKCFERCHYGLELVFFFRTMVMHPDNLPDNRWGFGATTTIRLCFLLNTNFVDILVENIIPMTNF